MCLVYFYACFWRIHVMIRLNMMQILFFKDTANCSHKVLSISKSDFTLAVDMLKMRLRKKKKWRSANRFKLVLIKVTSLIMPWFGSFIWSNVSFIFFYNKMLVSIMPTKWFQIQTSNWTTLSHCWACATYCLLLSPFKLNVFDVISIGKYNFRK